MKSIKKIALVAVVAIMSVGFASAQVGIQAGYSSAKSTADRSKALNGFHVGPIYNMTIQGPISLQYGLLYNFNSRKQTETATLPIVGTFTKSSTTTMHSLDVPVRVAASFPFGGGFSAFVFGGPNFNFGLAQSFKVTGSILGFEGEGTHNAYDDKDLSRFNLQLGLGAGVQFNSFGVKFSYDFGMLDMHKSKDVNFKENGMKIGLFYNF